MQHSSPLCCAARPNAQPSGPPCAARRLVQPSGVLCCAARPLVQPFGSLCCAGRPNVQLAGPPCFGPPFSAARRKFTFFNWECGPPARPALRLVSSYLAILSFDKQCPNKIPLLALSHSIWPFQKNLGWQRYSACNHFHTDSLHLSRA